MKFIELISLFLLALIAGGWMAVMVVFAPAYKRMSAATYIEADRLNTKRACKYFAPMLVLSAIFAIIFMIMHGDPMSRAYILSGISAVLLIATAIFVKLRVLSINAEVDTWSATAPPENWQAVRAKWVRYHNARTILGVTAFLLQAIAIIWG